MTGRRRLLSVLAAARECPDRTFLIEGGKSFSYAEIAERVRRALAWLDAQLPEPESEQRQVVAFVPTLDLTTMTLLLALIERGTTALLVHPRLTSSERETLLRDAAPTLTILDVAAASMSSETAEAKEREIDDEAILAILYTSGTTGSPKGAMLSRRAFLASADASSKNLGWNDDDRWLLAMPPAHVGGLSILVRCLIARACIVVPDGGRFEAETLTHIMRRDRVTIASLVPTMLKRAFVGMSVEEGVPQHLRAVLLGGAAPASPLLEEAKRRGWPVLTTYGLTESCSQVTTQRYGSLPAAEEGSGHVLLGIEVKIRDHDRRILVCGRTLMSGYFRRPDVVVHDDAGWFVTEDFGVFDEQGRLHVLGRSQELLVTGGENVYPLEVERVLESMNGVEAACVFGVPDDTWGEIVCAALVLAPAALPEEIANSIRNGIASHKRPRRVAIVEALPSTPAGKLDRGAIASVAMSRLVSL